MEERQQATEKKALPNYLNSEYIEKALQKALDRELTVKECSIRLDSGKGENFCSDIYRVHVKYCCKINNTATDTATAAAAAVVYERHFVIKDMIMHIAEIGSNELLMYEQVVPALEEILAGAGMSAKLKADCLFSDFDGKQLYMLEDLNSLGFSVADRCKGLDVEHASLLLQKIAQFHAASMVYNEQCPSGSASLGPAHFASGAADPLSNAITKGGMQHGIQLVEQWQDYEDIVAKMRTNMTRFNERMQRTCDPHYSRVNVINHGDLWVNNFLYSYRDNRPYDVIFVDFQNGFVGSPGYDINYVLYSSVQLEVLKTWRYHLLRCYYSELQKTLKACGAIFVPSWQNIIDEVRDCAFAGYYVAVCELPICSMSAETSRNFTQATFLDDNAMEQKRRQMYEGNARVIDTLRYALDYFNELQVLD